MGATDASTPGADIGGHDQLQREKMTDVFPLKGVKTLDQQTPVSGWYIARSG
jgi:hypothetical protein